MFLVKYVRNIPTAWFCHHHCRGGIGQVMSGARFHPDMTLAFWAKEFSLCFSWCPLTKSTWVVMCFLLRSGFIWPLYHTGLSVPEMVVLLEGSPLSTEQCRSCQSDHWVLAYLPDLDPSTLIPQIGISVPFSRSVPQYNPYNPVSEVYRQFLGCHGFVCALTYTVSYENLHRQVCAFSNHVVSTEFSTNGLQSPVEI